jgi:mannose-1-phosphate guanylyltransferase
MEKAENVYTLPADFGWSDLGSWSSIYQLQEKDAANNVVSQCKGLMEDTKNCLIHAAPDKLVVVKGLEDFIVVDDDDVLMIFPRTEEQSIKQVTQQLKEMGKSNYL